VYCVCDTRYIDVVLGAPSFSRPVKATPLRLSVCPICRPLQERAAAAAGLLLSAQQARDIDRLLPVAASYCSGV